MILRAEATALMFEDRRASILERDSLTRFTFAWGPLCRWPGATVDQVRERVERDLLRMVHRVG